MFFYIILFHTCLSILLQSQHIPTPQDVEALLFGMASQIAENEDSIVVEDLRGVRQYLVLRCL